MNTLHKSENNPDNSEFSRKIDTKDGTRKIHLQPVKLDNARIHSHNHYYGCIEGLTAGIRPCRVGLPKISLEQQHDKLICHNYGHGGAGWTLAHGAVKESLRLFSAHSTSHTKKPVTIIGAGVIGCITAIELYHQGYSDIKIIAKETEEIASLMSTGLFAPLALAASNNDEQQFIDSMGFDSHNIYRRIALGEHPVYKTGVRPIDVYSGIEGDTGPLATITGLEPFVAAGILPEPERVTVDFGNGKTYLMNRFQTLFMDTAVIMNELKTLLGQYKIPIQIKNIEHFSEINSSIIFNCTGPGAKTLCHDTDVYPNLGLLIELKNQPIEALDYIIYTRFSSTPVYTAEENAKIPYIYFMPRKGGLLGATFIAHNNGKDEELNLKEFQRILAQNKTFFGTEN